MCSPSGREIDLIDKLTGSDDGDHNHTDNFFTQAKGGGNRMVAVVVAIDGNTGGVNGMQKPTLLFPGIVFSLMKSLNEKCKEKNSFYLQKTFSLMTFQNTDWEMTLNSCSKNSGEQ